MIVSDIQPVHVDIWRNPDQEHRIMAGAIPIGDYEIEQSEEKHSFEGLREGAEVYNYWGDNPVPVKRGRGVKNAKS